MARLHMLSAFGKEEASGLTLNSAASPASLSSGTVRAATAEGAQLFVAADSHGDPKMPIRHTHFSLTTLLALLLSSTAASAAPIVITPTSAPPDLFVILNNAAIDSTQPQAGAGSAALLAADSFAVLEYGSASGKSFGTWGDLDVVSWMSRAPVAARQPQLALRMNYFGESDTFFVVFDTNSFGDGNWSTSFSQSSDGVIQAADGLGYVPPTIDPSALITGIHLRGSWTGQTVFADLPTLYFDGPSRTETVAFNLEPGVAVPEPATLALLGLGLAGGAVHRRRCRGRSTH